MKLKTSVIARPPPPHRIEKHFICQIHPTLLLCPSHALHFLIPYDFPYFTEENIPPIEKENLENNGNDGKHRKPTCIDGIFKKMHKMLVCQANNKCGK